MADAAHRRPGGPNETCFYCDGVFPAGDLIATPIPSKSLAGGAARTSIIHVQICRDCAVTAKANDVHLSTFLSRAIAEIPELAPVPPDPGPSERAEVFTLEEQLLVCAGYDGTAGFTAHPDYERILSVIVKNARAHVFAELGYRCPGWPETLVIRSLPAATQRWITTFLEIDHSQTWPAAGSRLMVRMFTAEDMQAGWVTVQPRRYAYAVFENGAVTVRSIIREYLLTEVSWGTAHATPSAPK